VVYSAGVTILAAFPRSCRFLTDDAVLLVHERQLEKSLEPKGPIKACIQIVTEQLRMLETAHGQELAGFGALSEGSGLSLDDLYAQASKSCTRSPGRAGARSHQRDLPLASAITARAARRRPAGSR
jgi:hypothetical protein